MPLSNLELHARLARVQDLLVRFQIEQPFDLRMMLSTELAWAKLQVARYGHMRRVILSDGKGRSCSIDMFDRYFTPPAGMNFTADILCMIEGVMSQVQPAAQVVEPQRREVSHRTGLKPRRRRAVGLAR